MSKLIYDDLIKGGKIFNRWEQAVKDAIDDNDSRITVIEGLVVPNPDFIVTGGTVSYKDIGATKIVEFETVNTFTLPQIATLSHTNFFVKLKNVSGGNITVLTNATDTIEGEISITLLDTETIELYISSDTEFKL